MARDDFRIGVAENPSDLVLRYKTKYVEHTIDINGKKQVAKVMDGGHFAAYNHATKEKGFTELPLKFIILEENVVMFSGFNEPQNIGVYSNQVIDKDSLITIRQGKDKLCSFTLNEYSGAIAQGQRDTTLSEKTKTMVKGANAKYTVCVFAVANIDSKWIIYTIELSGASLTGAPSIDNGKVAHEDANDGWFSFLRANYKKRYSHWIVIDNTKDREKGSSQFTIPIYELGDAITEEEQAAADDAMLKLRPYLDSLKSHANDTTGADESYSPAPTNGQIRSIKASEVLEGVDVPSMPDRFEAPPAEFWANNPDDDDLPF
jgi:hypothetical protein